jgi:hypothetical protein
MPTDSKSTTSYTPGVCNIGPAERRQRLIIGWVGAAITLLALVVMVVAHVPTPLRVLLAFPAVVAANGFLQYAMHFCVNFAMRGLYNFDSTGSEENVVDAQMRRADQRKGLQIIGLSLLIAAAVVVIAVLLP